MMELLTLLSQYGIPEWGYIIAVICAAMLLAKIIYYFIENYVKRLTEKTKTDLDDRILEALTKPFYALIFLGGAYVAVIDTSYVANSRGDVSRLLIVGCAFVVAYSAVRVLGILVSKWLSKKRNIDNTPQLLNYLLSLIVYSIAFLVILGQYNIDITPLIATLGVGGLAIGLALQSTLANFFAGLYVLSDEHISERDFVEMGDISGTIETIGWRSTVVRSLGNDIYVIPNSKLADSVIKNTSEPVKPVTVDVRCGVAYGSDLEKVQKTVEKAGSELIRKFDEVDGTLNPPLVFFTDFGDSNINFVVYIKAKNATVKAKVRHEYVKAIDRAFKKEKIEISWPVVKLKR